MSVRLSSVKVFKTNKIPSLLGGLTRLKGQKTGKLKRTNCWQGQAECRLVGRTGIVRGS